MILPYAVNFYIESSPLMCTVKSSKLADAQHQVLNSDGVFRYPNTSNTWNTRTPRTFPSDAWSTSSRKSYWWWREWDSKSVQINTRTKRFTVFVPTDKWIIFLSFGDEICLWQRTVDTFCNNYRNTSRFSVCIRQTNFVSSMWPLERTVKILKRIMKTVVLPVPVDSYILVSVQSRSILSSHLSFNREGCWATTDDFETSYLHFSLFSTALWDLANSRPVPSLMLSSHLFLCLPCLLPPFTVPCKVVLARPEERETWPYHCCLRLLVIVRRSSCGPIACWILARTSS